MKQYGDIELISGSIINLKVEANTATPTFSNIDEGRLVYNKTNKQLLLNNGINYLPIQLNTQNSEPLITTLGNIWINPDFTFDPTPFNDLPGNFIENLTSTDSLFSVISKINSALINISDIDINDINTFNVENPQQGDIIFYNGENFVNIPLSNLPDFAVNIALNNLNDVVINTPNSNDSLFFNPATNFFENKKWSFVYENLNPQTIHIVSHSLNNRYCNVTVINTNTNSQVSAANYSVVYNNDDQLTVTINTSLPVVILVTTIPFQ